VRCRIVPQGFVLEHCLGQDALCKKQTNKQTKVRLAALPTRSAVRAPWAAQVASLLAVTPLPTTGPRHIDIKAELSALQQRYLTSVSQSALPKVQLYLGQVADALCTDSYQMASYLKEVTSRAQLRRLAQLRTGSHQLRVETGRWERPRVARERRICQRCLSGEVDDEHHMVFDCPRWRRFLFVFLFFFWFVCLFFTEGVLTKTVFKNEALRHNAASHV
jgi:hypothetical protein